MDKVTFKDPHSDENRFLQNLFLNGVRIVYKISYVKYLAISFGFCLHNLEKNKVLRSSFVHKIFLRREDLWIYTMKSLGEKKICVLEFGVAWGYSTNFWLKKCNNIVSWHGYDTFEGLPESWRHYSKGHFSNSGKPPAIEDDRVHWYKGLVEDTFRWNEQTLRPNNESVLVFLDMDLFKPTYFILSKIAPLLKKGDMIYFDESHDIDELSLLHILLKINKNKFEITANTPCQTLLTVIEDGVVFIDYKLF